jgi:O-antigen/teichoic acid export membrane protein
MRPAPAITLNRPPRGAAAPAPAAAPGPARAGVGLPKAVLSVLDQAVASGTSFVSSVLIGRLGSREELGLYALALSVVLFLRGVQGELVASPYTIYRNRRPPEEGPAYAGSAVAHYLLLTLLATAGLLAAAALLPLGEGAGPVAWALAGAVPFLFLRDCFRQLSLAHLRLGVVLALDVSIAGLQLGGLLLLGWLGMLTVPAAYAVMAGACAAACLGWLLARPQPFRIVPRRLAADWRCNWKFSRWSVAGFLIGSTTPYVIPWLVAAAHGESATGLLAACTTIINCAGMYVTGVANFLTPRAAQAFHRGGAPELRRVLGQTAAMFGLTLGTFCLAILATGDLAATLVYGSNFAGSGPVLALLAFAMLASSLGITAGNGLWALDRPRANFLADVCGLVVTLAALVGLVGPLGVLGAAAATLTGAVTGAAVRSLTLFRLMGSLAQPAAPGRAVP